MLLVDNDDVFGLKNTDFNQRYEEVSVSLITTNVKQAQRIADSLGQVAVNDEQRIMAHMLSANLYFATGNMGDAIMYAMNANQIATTSLNTCWQAITSGFLATAFRGIGLLQASERYLTISNKANEQSAQKPMYILTKINVLHERAFHKFYSKDYTAAESILQDARKLIVHDSKESKKGILIKATNSQLLGYCYLHLDQLARADAMLQETLQLIGDVASNLQPYTYRTIAEVEMKKGNLQKAYEFLHLTVPYLKPEGVQELKMLVYESFAAYYAKVGELEKSNAYRLKATALQQRRANLANEVSDKLFENLNVLKDDYQHKYKLVISIALCLVFGIIIILLYLLELENRRKVMYNRLKVKLIELDNMPIVNQTHLEKNIGEIDVKIKEIQISEDTEMRLLREFNEQEDALFFLEKNVSLNSLALILQSNQRYTSYIIHKYRGKDYYAYIQMKRIEYIVDRLKKDSALLDYKLSHLADISGFSNPSKFSTAFKQKMGIPPSAFVHLLKKDQSSSGS